MKCLVCKKRGSKTIVKSCEVKIGGDTVSKWENNSDHEELQGTRGRL